MRTPESLRRLWVKTKYNVLGWVATQRANEVGRAEIQLARTRLSLEKVQLPLRILVSENKWLINGAKKAASNPVSPR